MFLAKPVNGFRVTVDHQTGANLVGIRLPRFVAAAAENPSVGIHVLEQFIKIRVIPLS